MFINKNKTLKHMPTSLKGQAKLRKENLKIETVTEKRIERDIKQRT